jgi:hypothetical protein
MTTPTRNRSTKPARTLDHKEQWLRDLIDAAPTYDDVTRDARDIDNQGARLVRRGEVVILDAGDMIDEGRATVPEDLELITRGEAATAAGEDMIDRGLALEAQALDLWRHYGQNMVDTDGLWDLINREPQGVRKALMRRRANEYNTGRARPDDIPEPACYRNRWPRAQPYWWLHDILRWGQQTGRIARDGTPRPPIGGIKSHRLD